MIASVLVLLARTGSCFRILEGKGIEVVVLISDFSGLAKFRGCSAFGDHSFWCAVRDNFHDLYNANLRSFCR